MTHLTTDRLLAILRECAGEGDPLEPTDQPEELDFAVLGYDSLALLETLSRLKREFGIDIEEDESAAVRTPAELTTLVNRLLARSPSA
ncbi:acyl carrier protein [Kitasatospora sp. NPDC002543]